MKRNRDDQARVLLEQAVKLYPQIRIAHYDLGVLDARQRNFDEAVSQFQQAVTMDPKQADAHYRLAEVYRAQGKTQLAQEELKKVAEIHETERTKLLHEISETPPAAPEP